MIRNLGHLSIIHETNPKKLCVTIYSMSNQLIKKLNFFVKY